MNPRESAIVLHAVDFCQLNSQPDPNGMQSFLFHCGCFSMVGGFDGSNSTAIPWIPRSIVPRSMRTM